MTTQDFLAGGQLIVAVLMLWSLIQSGRSLAQTRRQIEAANIPSVSVEGLYEDGILIANTGSSTIENFRIVGVIAARYNQNEEITYTNASALSPRSPLVHGKLNVGSEFRIPYSLIETFSRSTPPEGQDEAFAFVLRYDRSADHRPFFKTVEFSRSRATDSPDVYVYMPLHLTPGSGRGGPNLPVFKKLRANLRQLCVDYFDLEGTAGSN